MITLPGDNTLGDAPLLRTFEMQISGTFLHPYADANANGQGIADTLNARGWAISDVENASQNWFPQQTGFVYIVVGNVGSQYTDRQLQDQIQADLGDFFSVTGVAMISAPWTPPFSGSSNVDTTGIATGGANYSQTPGIINGGNLATVNVPTGLLSSFTQGLGISTPVILLAGGVILVLMLKK